MNKVVISGNLTKDVELKHTNSGTLLATVTVAVRRTNDITDFLPVTVWKQGARYLSDYAKKGDKVLISGNIVSRNYTDKDGNKRTAYEIWSNEAELMSRRPDATERSPHSAADEFDPLDEFDEVDSDSELPF